MEIAAKYQMTKNIRSYMFFTLGLLGLSILVIWWAKSGQADRFLGEISVNSRETIFWSAVITATLSFLVSAFLFYIWGNAKKHVLKLIELYDKKFPNAKFQWERSKKKKQ